MLWNLVESSEIVLFCIVFYGRPSGQSDTSSNELKMKLSGALLIVTDVCAFVNA